MKKVVITGMKLLGGQVCVEKGTPDEGIIQHVESEQPCGTTCGWVVSKELARVQCADDSNREHVVFQA